MISRTSFAFIAASGLSLISCVQPAATNDSSLFAKFQIANVPSYTDLNKSSITVGPEKADPIPLSAIGDKDLIAGKEYTFSVKLVDANGTLRAETKEGVIGCSALKQKLKSGDNTINVVACETESNKPIPAQDANAKVNISTIPMPSYTTQEVINLVDPGAFAHNFFSKLQSSGPNAAYELFNGKTVVKTGIWRVWFSYEGHVSLKTGVNYAGRNYFLEMNCAQVSNVTGPVRVDQLATIVAVLKTSDSSKVEHISTSSGGQIEMNASVCELDLQN